MANILIVDDEMAINELIKRNMRLVGHKCISAFGGKEALCLVDKCEFDLILLDVMLPEIDGFDLYERIRDIPTIFITAKNSLNDRLKGLNMGADDYLTKPFEMLELVARVDAEYIQKAAITEEEKFSATNYIMTESQRLQNMAYRLLDLAMLRNDEIILSSVGVSEVFYRVDKSRSRSEGGVGLGLSLCKEIATFHNAELSFSSILGEGTTAKIIFTAS